MTKKPAQPAQRSYLVALRVSELEHKIIQENARAEGKTVSAILRENLGLNLGRQTKSGRGKLAKRKAA
jgi:hypothetical protein